jgi:hypothetical protein
MRSPASLLLVLGAAAVFGLPRGLGQDAPAPVSRAADRADDEATLERVRVLVGEMGDLDTRGAYEAMFEGFLELNRLVENAAGTRLEERIFVELEPLRSRRFDRRPILWRAYWARGERILREMQAALTERKYALAFAKRGELQRNSDEMAAADPYYRPTAEDFATRGGDLVAQARAALRRRDRLAIGILLGAAVLLGAATYLARR